MKTTLVAAACVLLGLGMGIAAGYWQYNSAYASKSASPIAALSGAAAPSGPRPIVSIDETSYEFGTMEEGKSMSHDFVVFNRGTQPLKLEKGDTTCKCTLSELQDNVIQPGESATVTLEWRAEAGPGPFRQTATILTNDPLRPELDLVVNGEITQGISIDPTELVFTALPSNDSVSAKATIWSYFAEDLQITSKKFESSEGDRQFEVTCEPASQDELKKKEAKSGLVITVTSKPGLPLGPIRQKIVLETNVESRPTLEIPIQGTVTSDISVIGPRWNASTGTLRLGLIESDAGVEQTLKLVTRGPHRDSIEFELESKEPELLEVEIGDREVFSGGSVSQVPVTIRVPKNTPPVDHSGTRLGKLAQVRLKTNHPDVPQVRLLVQFVVED
jgi:hypothetical protein